DASYDALADGEVRLGETATIHAARRHEAQAGLLLVPKHQEAALGPDDLDELSDDAAEHLLQIERGVELLGYRVERGEALALLLEGVKVALSGLDGLAEASEGAAEARAM